MGGLEDADAPDGPPICEKKTASLDVSPVSCSICLDSIADAGDRSRAKLQCGHEFHLDCIGSAFNTKGAMQCPNCRKVEKGRWLYASGSTRSPEFSMDDWTSDEDPYELNYSEMPFRLHWCPFSGLARVHSSYEEMESPSTTYHNIQRHHTVFPQHTAGSSVPHSYVAYFGPIPPASSNTSETVEDPNFSQWNGISGHNEVVTAHAFPVIDIQYHSWSHHSHPYPASTGRISSIDQAPVPPATLRPARGEYDTVTRYGAFVHPFLYGHGSASRGAGSFFSAVVHPGNNSQSHERVQASHFMPRQHQPTNPSGLPPSMIPVARRSSGPRVLPQPEHGGGFFVLPPIGLAGRNPHEIDNSNHAHAWERDHSSHLPVVSQAAASGSDPGSRSSGLWHRHWS